MKLKVVPTLLVLLILMGCATVPLASKELDEDAKRFTAPEGKVIYTYTVFLFILVMVCPIISLLMENMLDLFHQASFTWLVLTLEIT